MRVIESPAHVRNHVGTTFGPGAWTTVTQDMIDRFADVTGDHQWIHVDVERAAREMPGGRTIAHGFLSLALISHLAAELVTVDKVGRAINYGSDKVRFLNPVPSGGRVRLTRTIKIADPLPDGGVRVVSDCVLELEGADKPALVADLIVLLFP